MKKLLSIIIALAMMMTLTVVAFAADPVQGTADNAVVAKYLKMAEGVTNPNADFTFQATAVSDSANPGSTEKMPAGKTATINSENMTASAATDDGASVVGTVKITDLIDGNFDHAGVFEYTVKEVAGDADVADGTMTYDDAEYTIRVYVKNGANGPEISGITVEDEDGNKVDPTDPDPSDDKEDVTDGNKAAGCSFTNSYNKVLTNDGENGVLEFSKTVAGDYADLTQAFPFTLTLTIPEEAADFTEVSYTEAGTAKTAAVTGGKVTINASLKNGEKLVINTLPAGTTYKVEETLADGTVNNSGKYTPEVDFADVDTAANTKGTAGANLAVEGLVADTDTQNTADYTNTYEDENTTPTGVIINNLPYIILAVVAVGGMVAYVAVKRRNKEEA